MRKKRTADNELVVSANSAAPLRRKPTSRTRTKRPIVQADSPITVPELQESTLESQVATEPVAVAAISIHEPSADDIAKLAYSYWESRGCQGGSPEEDWLRAEQELRLRASYATA